MSEAYRERVRNEGLGASDIDPPEFRTGERCIGFGPLEGKCDKPAGTAWSPFWCDSCNKERLDHVSKRLESMIKGS